MKNIVITGSTKGIGFGLAEEFVRRGHSVVISGRTDASVATAVEKLSGLVTQGTERAGRAVGRTCNVADYADVEALWQHAVAELGSVDLWINNAGLAKTTFTIQGLPPEEITNMVTTNMMGTIHGSKVALTHMVEQGGGQIFNMLGGGSDGSQRPLMAVYGSTKRGLKYFTDALVREAKNTPVQIGQIRPGMVVTEGMIREAREMGEEFTRQRKVMNILCDHVETVVPFLVDRILDVKKNGAEIAWMTNWGIAMRFMTAGFNKRDLFERHGV